MVIWKFELATISLQRIFMPRDAEILSVGNQNGITCLWAMVNPNNPQQERVIEIIGTGNPIDVGMGTKRKFIGTVMSGPFVWHVFEYLGV